MIDVRKTAATGLLSLGMLSACSATSLYSSVYSGLATCQCLPRTADTGCPVTPYEVYEDQRRAVVERD